MSITPIVNRGYEAVSWVSSILSPVVGPALRVIVPITLDFFTNVSRVVPFTLGLGLAVESVLEKELSLMGAHLGFVAGALLTAAYARQRGSVFGSAGRDLLINGAFTLRSTACLESAIAKGYGLEELDSERKTLLQKAIDKRWVEGVAFLIGAGVALDARNSRGETPLYQALFTKANTENFSFSGYDEHSEACASVLIDGGADIDALNAFYVGNGESGAGTVLNRAAFLPNFKKQLFFLCKSGADVHAIATSNDQSYTPMKSIMTLVKENLRSLLLVINANPDNPALLNIRVKVHDYYVPSIAILLHYGAEIISVDPELQAEFEILLGEPFANFVKRNRMQGSFERRREALAYARSVNPEHFVRMR